MKPKILFNFGYHRKGWIAPIESLADDIQIIYLFYLCREQESVKHTSSKTVYWSDYSDAVDLLNKIEPDRIVFMSVESSLAIALNFCARKKGIPTYILQHGVFSTYTDYRERERQAKKMRTGGGRSNCSGKFSSFTFLRSSLKYPDLLRLWKFPFYFFLQRKNGYRFASRWVKFAARIPDYYICYTPQNATIHRELDNPRENQLLYIGNPELDLFLGLKRPITSNNKYYLLIDQPFADNQYREHICSKNQMISHYLKLNEFCLNNNARLYVKLHPESYHSTWLPKHGNINWIKDHNDLPALIQLASGCFGYFSSLLIPAIYSSKVVLFRVSENIMQREAAELNLAQLLEFSDYLVSDIDFDKLNKEQLNIFADKYMYFEDGNSIMRLKAILTEKN